MRNEAISLLERWYASRCDGDWEQGYGVRIDTLDNPGWSVTIDLHGTAKVDAKLPWQKIEKSDCDWIHYRVEKKKFEIRCGPLNLSYAIELFVNWFDS